MPQFSSRLAREVERVLLQHGTGGRLLPLREAEERTRINYTTIGSMAKGHVPRPETLAKFALGFGENMTFWLELGGYKDSNMPPCLSPLPDDAEERRLLESFRRIPKDKQSLLTQFVDGLLS